MIDETHDPAARSWVEGADAHPDFPIQNLPLGIFCPDGGVPRIGCAIGDQIFDVAAFAGQSDLPEALVSACGESTLNALFALPCEQRKRLRHALFEQLREENYDAPMPQLLFPADGCEMRLPARVGNYTDFYIGIHHATNIGRLLRPDNPLLPNYKHIPIGYHGRASSIAISPDEVIRPWGQRRLVEGEPPRCAPSVRLDYEVEMGVWIAGSNLRGTAVPIESAKARIAGLCLLNDWSARDIQAWEYQPLGPFLSKNFATTISPWVVTAEALAPFRQAAPARGADDPRHLPYLMDGEDRATGGFSIRIEAFLSSLDMRANGIAPVRLSRAEMAEAAYWTLAQIIAHHTVGGCNLEPGDLLGTGTLSGPDEGGEGSLMERTKAGRAPISIHDGETRDFLQDGDEVTLCATAHAPGFRSIGFGACIGLVVPAMDDQIA